MNRKFKQWWSTIPVRIFFFRLSYSVLNADHWTWQRNLFKFFPQNIFIFSLEIKIPPVFSEVRVDHRFSFVVFVCFVCLRTVSCVSNVASVSWLSILICSIVFINLYLSSVTFLKYSNPHDHERTAVRATSPYFTCVCHNRSWDFIFLP